MSYRADDSHKTAAHNAKTSTTADNIYVSFFIPNALFPVLYLAADVYLHLIGIVGYYKIYKMFRARLELELALIEIAHAIHHYLYERHTIVQALRNDDG